MSMARSQTSLAIAMAWPKEYGGQVASAMEMAIFNEESARVRAPGPLNLKRDASSELISAARLPTLCLRSR